ncbi:serine protease inhibitor 42Dd-like [Haematobia irritans]|uniref:serine protease inhibitor 42Dd-like n=1 Tax=Haematobia irritans TaxID=7368 RepID=UPI003F4FA4D8
MCQTGDFANVNWKHLKALKLCCERETKYSRIVPPTSSSEISFWKCLIELAPFYTTALIIGLICVTFHGIMAGTIPPSAQATRNLFAADLFGTIAPERISENVVYSPASIQTCLALAFTGAEAETAQEMRKVLHLGEGDRSQVAQNYGEFLKNTFQNPKTNGAILKMANRIYVNQNLKISDNFNKIATEFFDAKAESVNFGNSQETINNINSWVEQQTESKIKNVLAPNSVDGDTSSVLVNAIHFKAKWKIPFFSTFKRNFKINSIQEVQVDMMYENDTFRYADLPQYNAKALEMPYEKSDLSMLVILPNEVEGLAKLESQLKVVDLNDITSKMYTADVNVFLPKFRIEFDIGLKEPLKKMGLTSMFSNEANFSNLFAESSVKHKVSDVVHKAFLDVNEDGCEAAAGNYTKCVLLRGKIHVKNFYADHPFVFAIRSNTTVYFAGHVVKF